MAAVFGQGGEACGLRRVFEIVGGGVAIGHDVVPVQSSLMDGQSYANVEDDQQQKGRHIHN